MTRTLIIDTGSPSVSLAIGREGSVRAAAVLEMRRSSELLLGRLDELLEEAGWQLGDLDALLALRGPGSFTGLRVGLATVLGLAQATGVRAGTLGSLDVMTVAVATDCRTVVYAQRGDWCAADYAWTADGPRELVAPRLLTEGELQAGLPGPLVGTELERLDLDAGPVGPDHERVGVPPLAPLALEHLDLLRPDWSARSLSEPLYFRAPAITPASTSKP